MVRTLSTVSLAALALACETPDSAPQPDTSGEGVSSPEITLETPETLQPEHDPAHDTALTGPVDGASVIGVDADRAEAFAVGGDLVLVAVIPVSGGLDVHFRPSGDAGSAEWEILAEGEATGAERMVARTVRGAAEDFQSVEIGGIRTEVVPMAQEPPTDGEWQPLQFESALAVATDTHLGVLVRGVHSSGGHSARVVPLSRDLPPSVWTAQVIPPSGPATMALVPYAVLGVARTNGRVPDSIQINGETVPVIEAPPL